MTNFDSTYPSLSSEEAKVAQKEQISFTQVVRSDRDPPVDGFKFVGVSNIVFDKPQQLRDGSTAYGYTKIRCYGSSVDDVQRAAEKIVVETDSKNPILIAPVGAWLPFTTSKNVVQETVNVGEKPTQKESDLAFSDEAIRKARADEKRKLREIQERTEELKKGDIYDKPESLEMYIMKRNVDAHLFDEIARLERQLKSFRHKQTLNRRVIHKLDSANPEYLTTWIPRYNVERAKAGIPDFVPVDAHVASYEEYRTTNEVSQDSLEKLLDAIIKD